jgi:hypothetical protein
VHKVLNNRPLAPVVLVIPELFSAVPAPPWHLMLLRVICQAGIGSETTPADTTFERTIIAGLPSFLRQF